MDTMYDAIGGAAVIEALAEAWHERVLADPVVSHAFDHGFREDHGPRLAAYWVEALGGPPAYTSAGLGDHSEVVRMHSGNGEHDDMDQRAVACFAEAAEAVGVPEEHRARLVEWFAAANAQVNHEYPAVEDVPDGLPMPPAPEADQKL